jgi:hypothetical protein
MLGRRFFQAEDFSFLNNDDDFLTAANNSPSCSGKTSPTNSTVSGSQDPAVAEPVGQDLLNRSCHDLMLPSAQVLFVN